MITEVPTGSDFRQSGVGFLNLAWESAITLALELDEMEVEEWDSEGAVTDEYWQAGQRPLATAIALAQQGVELLLKARIADVSPYLLVSGNPRDWPKGCDTSDLPFSEFRTLDAQDLVRAHDAVTNQRLPDDFKRQYEAFRRMRNTIFHTVNKTLRITTEDVIRLILETTEVLIQPRRWIALRREFLNASPVAVGSYAGQDVAIASLNRELPKVVELLKPAELRRFFAFEKRQRSYVCYNCCSALRDYWTEDVMLAQLSPNTPTSTSLHCIACDENTTVVRRPCTQAGCRSNVIEAEDGVCLVCMG